MKRTLAVISIIAFALSGCASPSARPEPSAGSDLPTTSTETPDREPIDMADVPIGVAASLQVADDCDALLAYFKEQALAQVGPWGLGGRYPYPMEEATEDLGGDAATSAGGDGSASPTSTNVQVEGVDEGDIVKADGDLLYVISGSNLQIFSTEDGGLEKVSTFPLGDNSWSSQMLIDGDRLVLMGAGSSNVGFDQGVASDAIYAPVGYATVSLIDVSDPGDPQLARRLTIDGFVVTTRLVSGHLRVVLQSDPVGLSWSYPEGSGLRSERDATERNRQVIGESTIENWLPYVLSDDGGVDQVLLDCGDVYLPPEPSGLGTLTILDFDIDGGVETWEAASVVASGSTVYADLDHTYVATSQWFDQGMIDDSRVFDGHITRIHRFDTPVDGPMSYVASGDVDGFLLNQFSMDHFDGRLRVASTDAPGWWGGGTEESESRVTVLGVDGNELVAEGVVEGLGVTETIRAVRFMGPIGYVVTFRQTDPLYVIDLSDPSNPVTAGELKIPGFSAYLHPVGEGRLLGVGQDADPETGQVKGLQLSLFDVSDPTAPTRIDTYTLESGDAGDAGEGHLYSPVEGDHKAFTSTEDAGYVPFEGWTWQNDGNSETMRMGVIEVDWSDDSLSGSRTISIFDGKPTDNVYQFSPQRTVVKGDTAYVVGYGGITVIDLTGGEVLDQVRF